MHSNAWRAWRLGRKPNEHGRKLASKMGSRTSRPRFEEPDRESVESRAASSPPAFPAWGCRPFGPPEVGTDLPPAARAAPPASAPPRRTRCPSGSRRRCRRRLCCVAPVARPGSTPWAGRSGHRGRETSADRFASRPRIARAEVHGLCRWGVGFRHALTRPLQHAHHRSTGPSLASSCVVSTVISSTTRSDSLRTALDFGVALYQGKLPGLSISPTGAGGSPQLTVRPSLHAISSTPERFRAAPESMARNTAFTNPFRARPARPLTGFCFDAAEFNFVTACSFVSPRFAARISPDAGG
jgi:hypothetical protein